jgi:guanosine-3',5'-bis(diphosphate) 3'-pyrophosphohydrolase
MLPGRFKDFISTAKPNGYRSLHTTIIGPERRKIEVQIRTREMHQIGELGVAAHWAYKQAYKQPGKPTEGRQYRWIRELLDILDHATGPEEFLEHTKFEMFQDQVFCFTPKGDLIGLPRGATPIDFAYAVHSEVGDHCIGAKVDGRMVQLRYQLDNGDQVEIITSRNATPSAAWERIVVTGKARTRIRRHLRSRKREEFAQQGRETLQKAAKAESLQLTDRLLDRALAALPHKTVEDLLVGVGEGNLPVRLVIEALRAEQRPAEKGRDDTDKIVPLRRPKPDPAAKAVSPIAGLPAGVAFQYAGCCHPIRGDAIVGLIWTGKPVAIHVATCPSLKRSDLEADRSIDISWDPRPALVRTVARLGIMALNKPGALGTVSTVIGKQGANIVDVRFGHRTPDVYEILIDVEVDGLEQLQRVQAALRTTATVSSVERVYG